MAVGARGSKQRADGVGWSWAWGHSKPLQPALATLATPTGPSGGAQQRSEPATALAGRSLRCAVVNKKKNYN